MTDVELTTEHLAFILNISREWQRERWYAVHQDEYRPMKTAVVQERMNAKFPASEHAAIWERLLVAIGVR